MDYPLHDNDDAYLNRFNKLFSAYIRQGSRVYQLPKSIKFRLQSLVIPQTDAVWVVDDDPDDQVFIKAAFNSICPDIPVTTFDCGEALLSRIAKTHNFPKIVLLDLNMPGVSGLDALRQLRSDQSYDKLTIVILTASSTVTSGDRLRAKALGVDQFYIKPTTYSDLVNLIRTITVNWCS